MGEAMWRLTCYLVNEDDWTTSVYWTERYDDDGEVVDLQLNLRRSADELLALRSGPLPQRPTRGSAERQLPLPLI